MNLNTANLKVVMAASTDEICHNLCSVHVTSNYTEATSGSILARISLPTQYEADDLPATIITDKAENLKPFTIPSIAVKSLKTSKVKNMPCLNDTLYVNVELTNNNSKAHFTATDLTQTISPVITKLVSGDDDNPQGDPFPDTSRVMPTDEPTYRVGFNATYLITLCQLAQAVAGTKDHDATVTIEGFSHRNEVIQGLVDAITSLVRAVQEPTVAHNIDAICNEATIALNRVDNDGCQSGKPWIMKAKNNDNGQTFTGLIMPVRL